MARTSQGDMITKVYGAMTQTLVKTYAKKAQATYFKTLDPTDISSTQANYVAEMLLMGESLSNSYSNISRNYVSNFAKAEGLYLPARNLSKITVPFNKNAFTKRMVGAGIYGYKQKLGKSGVSMVMAGKGNIMFKQSAMNVAGDFTNHVMRAGKNTVVEISQSSPVFTGFSRSVDGTACDFCMMLATRDNFRDEESASFEAHRSCGCVPEPTTSDWTPSKENLEAYSSWKDKGSENDTEGLAVEGEKADGFGDLDDEASAKRALTS